MKFIISAIIIGLLVAGGWFYYHDYQTHKNHVIRLYGNIDIREVNLGFRVFGRLQKMNFEEGDRIKENDLIAILDKQPYLDLVHAAQADVEQKKVAYQNAFKIATRKETLLKNNFASEEETQNAQTARDQALATLHVSQANLATALTNLKDTEVYSPSSGMILSRVKEPGTILNAGDNVYILALDAPVWVRCYVSEQDLGRIYIGMRAMVYTDSAPDNPYEGQIGFVSSTAEFTPKTVETEELRTKLVYRLRVIIKNPGHLLRQGMPVTVELDTTSNYVN